MSGEIVVYEKTHAVEKVGESVDLEYLNSRIMREKLYIVAPSEEVWQEYAASVGWQPYTQHGGNRVVTRGEQLITGGVPIGPFVLVVGMPLDLEVRLAVIGALTEMTPTWEAQGGRVVYVQGWSPSARALQRAGIESRSQRYAAVQKEYSR